MKTVQWWPMAQASTHRVSNGMMKMKNRGDIEGSCKYDPANRMKLRGTCIYWLIDSPRVLSTADQAT